LDSEAASELNAVGGLGRPLVLGSGKAGHEANALGVADALGAPYEFRRLTPGAAFAAVAPYGPVDPTLWRGLRDLLTSSPPRLAIACGRTTVPYLRAIKGTLGRRVFAVFLQDPRVFRRRLDLIWVPEHDKLRAKNVMTTLTSPHPVSPTKLAAFRASPDPRLAALNSPRAALLLGGPSGSSWVSDADCARLADAARAIARQGFSVMATPSRRTPAKMLHAVSQALVANEGFVWDGRGDNPYAAMLALADAILVTEDSANMISEAASTGAPVHVFALSGRGSPKLGAMIDGLVRLGAVRRFQGAIETFRYAPIDSSGVIAAEILRRFRASPAGTQ